MDPPHFWKSTLNAARAVSSAWHSTSCKVMSTWSDDVSVSISGFLVILVESGHVQGGGDCDDIWHNRRIKLSEFWGGAWGVLELLTEE